MLEKKQPIALFDSGVGGLTVLKEVEKLLPNENILYFGDNLRAPYGSRSEEEILGFCLNIGNFLEKQGAKILVIACNTATIVSLKKLQENLSIPVVGVIFPGAKAAVNKSTTKKIGVFATPVTIRSHAYRDSIKGLDQSVEVSEVPCGPLCQMIEDKWEDTAETRELLKSYIADLTKGTDAVVLGCTHYPIIQEYFERELKGTAVIVDPAKNTALAVEEILKEMNLLNDGEKESVEFCTSGDVDKFKELGSFILGKEISSVRNELN